MRKPICSWSWSIINTLLQPKSKKRGRDDEKANARVASFLLRLSCDPLLNPFFDT